MTPPTGRHGAYEYCVLRCVPRVEREECLNVGVMLCVPASQFLGLVRHVDADRLRALDPGIDLAAVTSALDQIASVCAGDPAAGPAARLSPVERFRLLTGARSTVIQPGAVHGGLLAGETPDDALERLADELLR